MCYVSYFPPNFLGSGVMSSKAHSAVFYVVIIIIITIIIIMITMIITIVIITTRFQSEDQVFYVDHIKIQRKGGGHRDKRRGFKEVRGSRKKVSPIQQLHTPGPHTAIAYTSPSIFIVHWCIMFFCHSHVCMPRGAHTHTHTHTLTHKHTHTHTDTHTHTHRHREWPCPPALNSPRQTICSSTFPKHLQTTPVGVAFWANTSLLLLLTF